MSDYTNLFSCAGKVALVAGSDGLVGREVCHGLRDAGAEVWEADISAGVVSDRRLRLDISSESSVEAALDAVVSRSGRLDVVVNCAYPRTADWGARIEDVPLESWTKNLDMQLGGSFALSRGAAERMKQFDGGSIIGFSSIYGMVGPSWEVYDGLDMTMPSAYAAVKAGVLGMSRMLATYYAKWGIRFNVVSPGGIADEQPSEFVSRYESLTPVGRMATPADIVGPVVFLASDAAAYVTGHNLVVDGGWTAR